MNDFVYLTRQEIRTNTLRVAEKFGKRHDNVLRDIINLDCSDEFRLLNFEETTYIDSHGRPQRMFELTRDGFMFLVMGFTGAEAARIKEAFIGAFNAMETEIRELKAGIQPKPLASSEYPATGSPFDNVQASKLGKLLRINKSSAFAYLVECGVTPDYVRGVLERGGALPPLVAPPPLGPTPAPLDHLRDEIPMRAENEDEHFWYLLPETFRLICGDYDAIATGRMLRNRGMLKHYSESLMIRAPRSLFGSKRLQVYAVSKQLGKEVSHG